MKKIDYLLFSIVTLAAIVSSLYWEIVKEERVMFADILLVISAIIFIIKGWYPKSTIGKWSLTNIKSNRFMIASVSTWLFLIILSLIVIMLKY